MAGKAAGIWNGIKHATGDIILFTDMDQSTPLKEVEKLYHGLMMTSRLFLVLAVKCAKITLCDN